MYTFFVVLIVLVSVLMIFIVLIQESKGGGLASQFSSTNQIMGVRKTNDLIENLTWGLAAAMVVISIACAYVAPVASDSESVIEKDATKTQDTNPTNTQGFGASAPAQGQQAAPAAAGKQAAPAAAGQKQAAPFKAAPAAGKQAAPAK